MPGDGAVLTLENIEIRQGAFRLHADFAVRQGARVAIMGPSGAGKSTLAGAICGFLPLTQGRILMDDTDITTADPDARGVAMIFQDGNLFPHLTLAQNVGLGLRPALRLSQSELEAVENALQRVGLEGLGARKPGQVSGGQQSRAALARVLLMRRRVLVLDEPFAALGPALRAEMLALVAEVLDETGATLLMVTHAPEDARRIAPETAFVAEGVAQAPQPTAQLLDDPPAALKAYLG